ncbi:MAG: hypothetical protein ACQES8_04150 [Thermodesulfobacteriota bacterium]
MVQTPSQAGNAAKDLRHSRVQKEVWHARKCTERNRKHRSYFQANYLAARLQESAREEKSGNKSPPCQPRR